MIKPYDAPIFQGNHTSSPIKLGSIIPDVIASFNSTGQNSQQGEEQEEDEPSITIVTDNNRAEVIELAKKNKLIIVHCWYKADESAQITLAPTTYLWDQLLDVRVGLVYADGITIEPQEQELANMETVTFTLYFNPLPPESKNFWLWEQTYEPFAFAGFDINRNEKDEYWVEVITTPF